MRLEKIVLDGFKSFADKTEFAFDAPVTAIVGPNGCGKSNVVDAVKWVLGEQRVKSLRSDQMADVIFSGSSSRKPLGSAEVTLFVSNTTGQLPIEADHVQISRRIYRSGESEYRINGKLCRLKDIRELFMDTGLNIRAYSIIEQGQVEQLISASRTDRRIIFEEAAGISKFKAHKQEALRKLDRTEQNLLRLADILGEVTKRLRSVKLQAGRARNYLEYTQRLKQLQLNYSLVEYAKSRTHTKEKSDALEKVQQDFAAVAAEISRNDALMSSIGQRIIETENQINQTDNSLVSVQSKIEQHLQRIEFLRTRITELQQRKTAATERAEKLQEQRRLFEADLLNCQNEQSNCERLLEEKNASSERLERQIQEIDAECTSLEADLEDEKSGIIDIVRITAQLHNEVQSISVYRDNLSSQKDRLTGRADSARSELEKLLAENAQHQARLGDIEKVLGELRQNLDSKRKKREDLAGLIEADNKRLAHSKETLSALSGELSVLTDMEARREGLTNAVKNILANRCTHAGKFDYVRGILADIVVADVKYATAVEAALEGKTDALVIDNTTRLLEDVEEIEKLDGRANFICADSIEPFVDREDLSKLSFVKGRLVEFVNYENPSAPLVWKLLGKTLVVESIADASRLASLAGAGYQFVTLKGEFLGADGTVRLGPLCRAAGLISRKSRLRQLQETIAAVAGEIAVLEQQLDRNHQATEHAEKLCKDLRTATYEANTEKMQVNSKLSIIEENIKRLKQEQPVIAGEIGILEEQIARSAEKEYNSKQKLEELDAVNRQRNERIEQLEYEYTQKKRRRQSLMNELTELKISMGQICEQARALKQTIHSLQDQTQANHGAADTARSEIQTCAEQSDQAKRDILNCESVVSELFVEKDEKQQSSRLLHSEVKELLEEQKQTEQLLRCKRAEEDEIEQKINGLKIELSQIEVKEQNLIDRVQEELQIDLVEAYKDYTQNEIDWERIKEEIAELRGKIERLGNVNIDAIDEQQSLEQRHEFLSSQVEDLQKSKAQLQQLINRLNKQSRERFRETFEQIRVQFQQIFRKLFGGGKADIVLDDAEDILEAGIEIIARPPGKETRSISLLSGGEKAMTAISLLFAVFESKPSPFCLLDEVDAALDEANNERFNLLIREFQKHSQFIIITHAKRTMSIADVLFGVTMQMRGVSKKISVKFGQFEEEAAAVA